MASTKRSHSNLIRGEVALKRWREDLASGKPPVLYRMGEGELSEIEFGPKRVALIGGIPGGGKTALTMQLVVDGLRLNPDMRACVCNVEMPTESLLERQLARLSGIDLNSIRHRRLTDEHAERLAAGLATLESVMGRLAFVGPPFDIASIVRAADVFGGVNLLVLDYVQRIGVAGNHESKRTHVNTLMEHLRAVADLGVCVIAISAVGRTKDKRGRSSYSGDGLGLASFKESGELEYGADDAFLLVPDKSDTSIVELRHLKARHGSPKSIDLEFNGSCQCFTAAAIQPASITQHAASPAAKAALAAAWGSPGGKKTKRGGAS